MVDDMKLSDQIHSVCSDSTHKLIESCVPEATCEAKHTPGPWHVDPDIRIDVVDDEHNPGIVAKCDNEANARLIATAPELLEALQEMNHLAICLHELHYGKGTLRRKGIFARVDDAIRKAKGEL